ncbi:MAG: hypothetical protein ACPKPY_12065 [Nitrososphaeraceae archaeon]
MAEKMTAFWLVILTIVICISVPLYMLILTTPPSAEFIFGIEKISSSTTNHMSQQLNFNFN